MASTRGRALPPCTASGSGSRSRLCPFALTQLAPHDLARGRRRQAIHKLDRAWAFVAAESCFHELADLLPKCLARCFAVGEHQESLDALGAHRVRHADRRGEPDCRVPQQRLFDLARADAIAGRGDDVVGATVLPEVAVLVAVAEVA